MPAPHHRILIAGYYGFGNAGDEAILQATLDELRALRPDLELVVASGDPARTTAAHGVPAVHRDDVAAVAAAVRGSDLVLLGGGGLLEDYWEVPLEQVFTGASGGLPAYLGIPLLATLCGKPCMLYAVGVGPLRTAAGRRMAAAAFELASAATVRDEASLAEAMALGLSPEAGARIAATADPATLLDPIAGEELEALAARLGLGPGERPIGVALRPWQFAPARRGWEDEVAAALARFAADEGARLLLLPFHPAEDSAVLRRLAASLPRAVSSILPVDPLEPRQLAALLGRCRCVLAMRYHAGLFALTAGVPVAALAYDPKVRSLVELAGGAAPALGPEEWTASSVVAALRGARAADPGLAGRLRQRAMVNGAAAIRLLDSVPARLTAGDSVLRQVALDKVLLAASQEGELAVQRRRIDELAGDLAGLDSTLAHERHGAGIAAERLRGEIRNLAEAAAARTDEAAARAEEARALAEQAAARSEELRRLREQREWLVAELDGAVRRLTELEGTLAYALVSRFWRLMRRLFPRGSRRRAIYRLGRRTVAAMARVRSPPRVNPPASVPAGGATAGAETAGASVDPLQLLLAFEDEVRRRDSHTAVAIFSATQLLESEGQRPTRLALALARRGIPVVFVYWRWWEHEWRPQDRLEGGILQVPIDVVARRPEMLTEAFPGLRRLAFFEFPWPGFFTTLAAANAAGWITVYDGLDDWAEFHRVGQAIWYEEPFERHLVTATDAVFAINETLADRLRGLGALTVEVVGNGFEPGLELVREPRPLARGEVTVGYFGYLAGAWFDWELVAAAARRRPTWRFHLVGYGGSPEGVRLPDNVVLLGKQPHGELAAIAANWDVAMVPFKAERLAAGADPIKTYEYLALGLPVVATGVQPPAGAEGLVRRAEGVAAFVDAVAAAAAEGDRDVAARRAFAATCTWDRRLDAMLATVETGAQRVAEKRALAGTPS